MARLLLLLPTGTYRAEEYLAAARRLGIEVVVGSERAQALASTMGENFLELPLDRPDEAAARIVAQASREARLHLDAVVAVDDQGLLVAALAARHLGLRHNTPEAVALTRNKAAMREAFRRAGVPQPDFVIATSGSDAEVVEAAEQLGSPVVVKPCTLSGSRGVIRADSARGAGEAASRVRSILEAEGENTAPLLVERFVPGPEVAVEGLLRGGSPEIITIFDKPDPLDGPYFEETLYVSPTALPSDRVAAVEQATGEALRALGLVEGPFHAELRAGADLRDAWAARTRGPAAGRPAVGGVAVLEVAARTIGGRCSKAMVMEDNSSLEELVLRNALGLPYPPPALASPCGVLMIPIPKGGTLRKVEGIEAARALPGVTGVEVTIPIGRPVRPLPEGDRYLGFVFAAALQRETVEAALRGAESLLVVDVTAETPDAVGAPTVVRPATAPRVR